MVTGEEVKTDNVTLARDMIQGFLAEYNTGMGQRNNLADMYIAHTPEIFKARNDLTEVPMPLCVQFEITNLCSTGCKMCKRYTWVTDPGYKQQVEMSTDRQLELMAQLSQRGTRALIWTGGEPIMHPNFERLLTESWFMGHAIGILSNGVGITQQKAELILQHAAWIRISLDDVPTTRKRVRSVRIPSNGSGYSDIIDEVERSLTNLAQAHKALKNDQPGKVGLAYTIQKSNIKQVPVMIDYINRSDIIKDLGIVVNFKIAHGHGQFLCSWSELNWLRVKVLSDPVITDNPHVDLSYLNRFFFKQLEMVDIVAGQPTQSYYKGYSISCFTPYLYSLIDLFGNVTVCCHLYDDNGFFRSAKRDRYIIGNVAKKDFHEVWQSNVYKAARANLSPIVMHNIPCGECTRHWVPNTILSNLYDQIFSPLVTKFGLAKAGEIYTEALALADYSKDHTVWF